MYLKQISLFAFFFSLYSYSYANNVLIGYTRFGQSLRAMDLSAPPVALQPIRIAKGTVRIDRIDTTYDNVKNDVSTKTTPICTQKMDVNVYDLRGVGKNYTYNMTNASCDDVVNNIKIHLTANATLLLANSVLPGIPGDYKIFSASAFYTMDPYDPNLAIPAIPYHAAFTPDLNQVHFGAIGYSPYGVSCSATSDPVPVNPQPSPRIQSSQQCTVINPVSYQAIWTAEDRP